MLVLSRVLIAIGSALVPSSVRDDWTREWEAELWHHSERLRRGAPLSVGAQLDLVLHRAVPWCTLPGCARKNGACP